MTKAIFIMLLSVGVVHAEDILKPAVPTAERAIARFQEARDTELKGSLTSEQFRDVVRASRMPHLEVRIKYPEDYKTIHGDVMPGGNDPGRFVGSFAAVADCKTATWQLDYSDRLMSVTVYLDAITGKILYLYETGEG